MPRRSRSREKGKKNGRSDGQDGSLKEDCSIVSADVPRRSRSRERGKKKGRNDGHDGSLKQDCSIVSADEPRRSRSRERGKKKGRSDGHDGSLKQELAKEIPKIKNEVIDLDEEFPDEAPPTKVEAKRETKAEPREERRVKEKKNKVKKEKRDDDDPDKNRDARRQQQHRKSRSNSRRRKKKSRSRSSSSSSSSSTESVSDLYRKFKPYTKVQLVNLVRKADLNGMTGQVIHPSTSVSPCPPGCLLVRLETGREIAVKPPNLTPLRAFHVGPQQAKQSQEDRLQQVLSQIKMNVDNVMERTMALRDDGSSMLLDGREGAVQGGIGHML